MPHFQKLKILVAPLDWGLGHTTRCIPIINELLKKGVEVLLAGNEVQKKILEAEFPQCTFLPLNSYNVKYAGSGGGFMIKMMRQLPRILSVIKAENAWLKQIIAQYNIDGVISDNRFGLYHAGTPCVFVTHQLQVKTGMGKAVDILARNINYRQIKKFSACWIPDFEGTVNLGGELSHPAVMPVTRYRYIGPLSRIDYADRQSSPKHILFILSGPEPQRTIFENRVFEQLEHSKVPVVIVRGLPLDIRPPVFENAIVYNHLSKNELQQLMQEAEYIVCRSGYSSVMDINAMKAKAILIPTPGQTEQEYLAVHLMKNKFAVSDSQRVFDMRGLLEKAGRFSYEGFIKPDADLLSKAISIFLEDCRTTRSAIL
ncbi:MAG TPA: glycosyltransferase [Niabella sp.]|nr:glycosyltransferase [Niabella sp.]